MKKVIFAFMFAVFAAKNVSANSVSFIQGVSDSAFSDIVKAPISDGEAKARFKDLIKKKVALTLVAKQLLVRQDRLDALQKANKMSDFQDFVAGHLARIYASRMRSGGEAKITVEQRTIVEKDPVLGISLDVVTMKIKPDSGADIKIQWYVAPNQGIVDAKVDGKFRMSTTLKGQYSALWDSAKGNPEVFMKELKSRLG